MSTTRPPLTFSSTGRTRGRGPLRVVGLILAVVLLVALGWALTVGAVWGYAWLQLGADDVAQLRDDVSALGTGEPTAPDGATTVLVTLTGPTDPTVPRPPALEGPIALVQFGGPREEPAVLALPRGLEVSVDGEGGMRLVDLQRDAGLDGVTRAVIDYSQVRVDHAVSLTVDALPRLVDAVAGVEVCAADSCATRTGTDVRARITEATGEELVTEVVAVTRGLGAALDHRWALTSPLEAKRVIDALDEEVITDVGLRGRTALDLASALAEPGRIDLDTIPMVRNPATDEVMPLEEPTAVRFDHLRQGTAFEGDDLPDEQDLADAMVADATVAVLNAAGVDGLAGETQVMLEANGFAVVGTGNAPTFDRTRTVVNVQAGDPELAFVAERLAEFLDDARVEAIDAAPEFEGEPVDLLVLVGEDLAD